MTIYYLCNLAPLKSFSQKLRGLLGTNAHAWPVLLCSCDAIHTFGMTYKLDIAFLDKRGLVLWSERALKPWSMRSYRQAYAVLERPCNMREPWPRVGDWVAFERRMEPFGT